MDRQNLVPRLRRTLPASHISRSTTYQLPGGPSSRRRRPRSTTTSYRRSLVLRRRRTLPGCTRSRSTTFELPAEPSSRRRRTLSACTRQDQRLRATGGAWFHGGTLRQRNVTCVHTSRPTTYQLPAKPSSMAHENVTCVHMSRSTTCKVPAEPSSMAQEYVTCVHPSRSTTYQLPADDASPTEGRSSAQPHRDTQHCRRPSTGEGRGARHISETSSPNCLICSFRPSCT